MGKVRKKKKGKKSNEDRERIERNTVDRDKGIVEESSLYHIKTTCECERGKERDRERQRERERERGKERDRERGAHAAIGSYPETTRNIISRGKE